MPTFMVGVLFRRVGREPVPQSGGFGGAKTGAEVYSEPVEVEKDEVRCPSWPSKKSVSSLGRLFYGIVLSNSVIE